MPYRALLLCLSFLCLQAGPPQFQKVGKGPGILLIHGFGGNKEVWAGVAAELAQDHTVLSVDLPGSGGTPARRWWRVARTSAPWRRIWPPWSARRGSRLAWWWATPWAVPSRRGRCSRIRVPSGA
ncbi:MAG: alpha/beta fold hydrolase [Holophagaceae bacterium]|nr:alpha/beta fold hydrolase [Holophagaceae bacterium]